MCPVRKWGGGQKVRYFYTKKCDAKRYEMMLKGTTTTTYEQKKQGNHFSPSLILN